VAKFRGITKIISNSSGLMFLGLVFLIVLMAIGTVLIMSTLKPTATTRGAKLTVAKLEVLADALQRYDASHKVLALAGSVGLPASLDQLVPCSTNPSLCNPGCVACNACVMDNTVGSPGYLTLQGWCGPYVDQVFQEYLADYKTDEWGTAIQYFSAGPPARTLRSWGPNRTDDSGLVDDISITF
jgi:type II secretory pathway pseudopilin PulG